MRQLKTEIQLAREEAFDKWAFRFVVVAVLAMMAWSIGVAW